MSNFLRHHGLQPARLPCPSPSPGVYSNSCPLNQWCHPTVSSCVAPFSSHPQSFPASGSFPMSQLFSSGCQVLELQYRVNKPAYCVPYILTKVLSPQSFDVNTCAINHILLFLTQCLPNTDRACTELDLGFLGSLKKDILKDTDVHDLNLEMRFTRWNMYKNYCFSSYGTALFPTVHSNGLYGNWILKYIENLNMYR